ncbi:hypothetical protein SPI_06502 [Niveomyces insectorum RCEF 264]|uniref:Uncharacterized protein n=1 Tax=Niveomyces insectorum RCEF 264 TaxID=1081102 RepID=A0A167RB22_9HYPO|nr:hypothetical protein SPI_06502 [Niveomyces insectorum RCEF 264]
MHFFKKKPKTPPAPPTPEELEFWTKAHELSLGVASYYKTRDKKYAGNVAALLRYSSDHLDIILPTLKAAYASKSLADLEMCAVCRAKDTPKTSNCLWCHPNKQGQRMLKKILLVALLLQPDKDKGDQDKKADLEIAAKAVKEIMYGLLWMGWCRMIVQALREEIVTDGMSPGDVIRFFER